MGLAGCTGTGALVEVESLLSSGRHEPLPQNLLGTVVGQLEGEEGSGQKDATNFLIYDTLSLTCVKLRDEVVMHTLR